MSKKKRRTIFARDITGKKNYFTLNKKEPSPAPQNKKERKKESFPAPYSRLPLLITDDTFCFGQKK